MNGFNRLKDQVAVVTGGSRGIGLTIARKLASEGAKILIADILEEESRSAVKELCDEGYAADCFILDVSNVEEIYKMTDYCEKKFGKIDILINNAGIQKPCPSMKLSEEAFDKIMDINIKGAFFCSQAAGKVMRKNGGGKIVSISSGNSRMVNIGRAPYCISKKGINGMTAVLGAEWAMYGIRVNAVAPGWIYTAIVEKGLALKAISQEQVFSVSPVERWGTEQEIADLVCYLCSDESTYVVGQTIFCDGGWNTGMLPNALDFIRQHDTID
ncbi:glucose 1-dehydrogenase [Petroclostridium sp. X23]|uniref:SDR family NAD(P)-dependent oxidoreductase n=1 Tax=Petroclostridium sp. X23 TaxID=3045146 RepID=UPI0024AD7630|nr:glucose 1-dehydrogenase [Petroclostridium sp. X23]WHH56841.1 glucose 1-dehydrogenase [Petroclostridium sp. X23]